MIQMIGQVYSPRFIKGKDGKKDKIYFNVGTRRAFVEDEAKSNVFTTCLIYGPDTDGKSLNEDAKSRFKAFWENYGQDAHKGKGIFINGQFEEYPYTQKEVTADNKDMLLRQGLLQKRPVTKGILEQSGFKLADDNEQEKAYVLFTPTVIRTEFVVRHWEFLPGTSDKPVRSTTKGDDTPVLIASGDEEDGDVPF